MKDFSELLNRLTKVLNKKEIAKDAVIEVIKKTTRVNVKPENITVLAEEGVLEIEVSPAAKSEIMLKEKRIIDELKEVYSLNIRRIFYK